MIGDNKVWVIGGTRDSADIANILAINNILFVVSVVTPRTKNLYSENTEVIVGCMNLAKMQSFCQQENIRAIVDASHPYAVEVSQNAIASSKLLNIPYLRYERSNYQSPITQANSLITKLDSFETLLAENYLQGQRVLLTIGCKTLPRFQSWQNRSTLYTRILPTIESLKIANNAGFPSDRIITIRPPLSFALEKALWQQWNISLVITKASGKAGGEDIKSQVAAELSIPLIIITRPKLIYPQQTYTLQGVLTFLQ